MQEAAIAWALAQGAPVTCATCPLFHAGNMHCGETQCGGPGMGRDFPCYAGPIPREKFVERCLVCGAGSPTFLIVGLPTKFALCRKHRKVYNHVGAPSPDHVAHSVSVVALQ